MKWLERTHQQGAGPVDRTASGRGRCTCCSSSGSHGPAGPGCARRPAAASRSRRSSSPGPGHGRQMFIHQMARRRNSFTGVYISCPKHAHTVFLKAVKQHTWSKFTQYLWLSKEKPDMKEFAQRCQQKNFQTIGSVTRESWYGDESEGGREDEVLSPSASASRSAGCCPGHARTVSPARSSANPSCAGGTP